MEKPFFSVIVTVYNLQDYIRDCVDSILSQTYSNIEILIIDDGSTDDSCAICDDFAMKDERVKVIHKKNEGLTKARKEGIKSASGEYIVFIDGDDWIDKETCRKYYNIIENNEPDIIIDGVVKEYGLRSVASKNAFKDGYYNDSLLKEEILPYMIYTGNFYEKGMESYICSKAVKRSILLNVSEQISNEVNFAEGGLWLYSSILASKSAVIISNMFYHYRMRHDSMTMSSENEINSIKGLYEELIKISSRHESIKECLVKQIDYFAMYFLLWRRMDLFGGFSNNNIWPYKEVKQDSRIIIYGAWRYGKKLIEFIRSRNAGKIVMIVDQNYSLCTTQEYEVKSVESILQVDYDYIILGSLTYSVICSMKEKLQSLGITDNILYVTKDKVNPTLLPNEFKIIKERYA